MSDAGSAFERVLAYHQTRGDDYSSDASREAKYRVLLEAFDYTRKDVLDAGCGTRQLAALLPKSNYTGIDLLEGQNVLDEIREFDIVVAGGIFYLLSWEWMCRIITHMWGLAREGLVFNTLSSHAPDQWSGGFYADPVETLRFCLSLSPSVILRHDYLPHDFTVALYRAPGKLTSVIED
jgi:hypothetical protein